MCRMVRVQLGANGTVADGRSSHRDWAAAIRMPVDDMLAERPEAGKPARAAHSHALAHWREAVRVSRTR